MSELKKTSLHQKHLDLKAKMVDFGGWEMPIQYQNLKEEVVAVREKIGVFDVSHMGEFHVSGRQALDFVDYLVTNDIKSAAPLKAVYSPMLNSDGGIIDDLIVYKFSDTDIYICVNAANIEKDFAAMSQHKDKFDCEFKNLSGLYSLLAIQGPQSFSILKELITELNDIDYYSVQKLNSQDDIRNFAARTGYTGEDGFEIFGSHKYISDLWEKLMQASVQPCGLGARDVLRLEACYSLYGNELNDDLTPLETGLKWTVKMDKTSFVGKEALQEKDPRYRLLKLSLDKGIPRAGYKVEDDQGEEIGVITSGSMSVTMGKGIALARINKNLYEDSKKLNINIRNKIYPAVVNKKPFISGRTKS